jgi:hypothetical protein
MGGTALMIYGTPSAERLAPRPLPRTLLDRLLGRTRTTAPRVTAMGRRELTSLDATGLRPLIARYRGYLARNLPNPSEASRGVLEYLQLKNIPSLYLRGDRESGGEPEWYTQVGFSGCGGTAEVSALVAAHWAAAWVRDELPSLNREIFAPFGFTPIPDQTFGWPDRFLPVAPLGYLRYVPSDERGEDGLTLEADQAVLEEYDDADARLTEAVRRHGSLMEDGRCRCQLCAPDFIALT